MAGRNTRTITECFGERNEERSEKCIEIKQTSYNGMNNETTEKAFTVQNYRDYNVYSDVENVLNLNPVSYIDHVQQLRNEENKKNLDLKEDRETATKSLITNFDNRRDKPSFISTSINIASHIIAPAISPKRSKTVSRIPRRDDSEKNYYDDLALNEETNSLFGNLKTRKSHLVIKYHSIKLFSTYLLNFWHIS